MRRDRVLTLEVPVLTRFLLASAVAVGIVACEDPAFAAPSPSAPAAAAGQQVCTINKPGLVGISGLVARADGYVVVTDSQPDGADPQIYFLNANCGFRQQVSYPNGARDPEDITVTPDGALWIADIGDNAKATSGSGEPRPTIALWSLANGQKPVVHRFKYPDGQHDAEALVMSGPNSDTPLIITKETNAAAGLYVPAAAMQSNNTVGVPLRRVGEFKPPASTTPSRWGAAGHVAITGAARSPDGKRVAVRTYADAYEWDIPDGDVVKALTAGKPRATPLPTDAMGESIAYSVDGKSFLTVSDVDAAASPAVPILRYAPAGVASSTPSQAANAPKKKPAKQPLMLQDILYMVAGIGVLGMLLVIAGVIGIRRSRKLRRAASSAVGKVRATASVGRSKARVVNPLGTAAGPQGGDDPSGYVKPPPSVGPEGWAGNEPERSGSLPGRAAVGGGRTAPGGPSGAGGGQHGGGQHGGGTVYGQAAPPAEGEYPPRDMSGGYGRRSGGGW